MTFLKSRRNLSLAALAASLALTFAGTTASAQQITYYDFDTPATASPLQYSYGCTPGSASNPLFCFNFPVGPTALGTTQNPTFVQDPSSDYAVQMTHPETSQDASMWFSVPQNVANGFNVWFQFRITSSNAYATADGLAFVIQNALSGGVDTTAGCTASGQGPTALGGGGGCMGYGGIPNSVALEFDTYNNEPWDSADYGAESNDANHIALQSCGLNDGAPLPNSPAHEGAGNCLVSLGGTVSTLVSNPQTSAALPATPTAVTLADGQVHNVVIVYNGPLDTPMNTISVYLDPQFNEGTYTPVEGSKPIFTGPFDITQYMNLTNGSAYVGFTSATGSAYETHEVLGWTFTPHTTVSQTQPLNPQGTPTTFNFGTHSYTATIPADTTDISMGVIANTITPGQFSALLGNGPTQYTGSQCQVYDDTGGKCIIYSVYCYYTDTKAPTACPAPSSPPPVCSAEPNAGDCIDLTSAYNNTIQPTSAGYLQGDPLFSPISSISTTGTTATVTCLGECAVTPNQTVTILDQYDNPVLGATNVTVQSSPAPTVNTFTFSVSNSTPITQTGGFITSNNVKDIFVSYNPQNIDGSTAGHSTGWSDFVVTGVTNTGGQMTLSAPNNGTATVKTPVTITATITIPSTVAENGIGNIPNNLLTLLPALSPGLAPSGTVSFYEGTDTTVPAICSGVTPTLNSGVYQATCSYTPAATGPDTITATYTGDSYHVISNGSVPLTVNPQTVVVNVGTIPPGLSFSINGTTYSTAQSPAWNIGTSYTIATSTPQPGTTGTQYVFSSWSDGGALSHPVQAPSSAMNYTASFTTQYLLNAVAGAGGSVSSANGYYNAQSMQNLAATPNPGYVFSGWTGSGDIASPSSAATTITMNGPENPIATFTAVPVAGISPPSIDFGTLYLGSIVTKLVTVSNTGAAPMTIQDPLIALLKGGNSNEFVTLNLCPKTLAVGKSCYMTVTFIAGPFYTPQTAVLTINDNAPGGSQTVPLTALVINPRVGLSASSLNFGTHKVGTSTSGSLKITNTGATTLSITSIKVSGADPLDFPIGTCPSSLTAGVSCVLGINFTPQAAHGRSATLVITDNAQNSPQSVSLAGTGTN